MIALKTNNLCTLEKCQSENARFLARGVLTEHFVLNHWNSLVDCIRNANIGVNWRMLHLQSPAVTTTMQAYLKADSEKQEARRKLLVQVLLSTAHLEFVLRERFKALLASKGSTWENSKVQAEARMLELSKYFSPSNSLNQVLGDAELSTWFTNMAQEVRNLSLSASTLSGRRIQALISALREVAHFDEVGGSLQVRQFVEDSIDLLKQMILAVGLRDELLVNLDIVSNFTYAWTIIEQYTDYFHEMIRKDPQSVSLLRTLFLKMAGGLDVPLVRIAQAHSTDTISVAEFYSTEMVDYVRSVLEIGKWGGI